MLTEYAKTSAGKAETFNDLQKEAADVNMDNVIDARDATIILTYYSFSSTGHNISLVDFIRNGKETV